MLVIDEAVTIVRPRVEVFEFFTTAANVKLWARNVREFGSSRLRYYERRGRTLVPYHPKGIALSPGAVRRMAFASLPSSPSQMEAMPDLQFASPARSSDGDSHTVRLDPRPCGSVADSRVPVQSAGCGGRRSSGSARTIQETWTGTGPTARRRWLVRGRSSPHRRPTAPAGASPARPRCSGSRPARTHRTRGVGADE